LSQASPRVPKAEKTLRLVAPGGGVGAIKLIRGIRRVLANGFAGRVFVSDRPCFTCDACVARRFKECSRSAATKMEELEVAALSAVDPLELRSKAKHAYEAIAREGAKEVKTLALETFSDEVMFYLVKPIASELGVVRKKKVFEHYGVRFEVAVGDFVLRCKRFTPRSVRCSSTFVLESNAEVMDLPAHLCRASLVLKEGVERSSRSRATGGKHYELKGEDRLLVEESCRLD